MKEERPPKETTPDQVEPAFTPMGTPRSNSSSPLILWQHAKVVASVGP